MADLRSSLCATYPLRVVCENQNAEGYNFIHVLSRRESICLDHGRESVPGVIEYKAEPLACLSPATLSDFSVQTEEELVALSETEWTAMMLAHEEEVRAECTYLCAEGYTSVPIPSGEPVCEDANWSGFSAYRDWTPQMASNCVAR